MSEKSHTPEQVAAVQRVRRCKATAFYEILDIKIDASDLEIKKAYRKLALIMHPDKNKAPGADEAFKMISRAFQILSDPQKRSAFDANGQDPDSRSAGMSNGASSGFPSGMRGSTMFQDEISPEELFNMFFGGGAGAFGGGSPFGQGPTFTFGGPGIRVHQFGGVPRRRATRQPSDGTETRGVSNLLQLLPLLLIVFFPLLSSIFSGSDTLSNKPNFAFNPSSPYTHIQYSPQYNIPYYVDPKEVSQLSNRKQSQLGSRAETIYIRNMQQNCELEYQDKQRKLDAAQGWFFIDYDKYNEAAATELKSCNRLRQLGLRHH